MEAGANSCARENFGQSDFGTPGCRIKEHVAYGAAQLALAKAALASFDLPLVVDHFDLQVTRGGGHCVRFYFEPWLIEPWLIEPWSCGCGTRGGHFWGTLAGPKGKRAPAIAH